ncbi:hypothetical protein Ari01nite_42930 [Paractinoplanes rishiriensis]|uniref:Uncharacterized protein n=1 Tax=Paractinoplanes rishiriensis TaxID=1050105 RepID=A0A919K1B8_9ACTN|nr:hypothetical protein Ari01nite_42930 [Actinoplanes rishiriensis]
MADVSLGLGSTEVLSLGSGLALDAVGEGTLLGAVGVGTGGKWQLPHSGFVGFRVRIGLAFGVLLRVAGTVVFATGSVAAAALRVSVGAGPAPSPALGVYVVVAAGGAGKVSAAAGVSCSSDPRPCTTPR